MTILFVIIKLFVSLDLFVIICYNLYNINNCCGVLQFTIHSVNEINMDNDKNEIINSVLNADISFDGKMILLISINTRKYLLILNVFYRQKCVR